MKIIYIIIALINFAFSIDNTTVKTDFDERGLPVFISPQHELNWYLDRLKPQQIKVVNQTSSPVNFEVVVKQIYGPWPYRSFPSKLESMPKFSLQDYNHQTNEGDVFFEEGKYQKINIKPFSQTKTCIFQLCQNELSNNQELEFTVPYGCFRSIKTLSNFDFSFDQNSFQLLFCDNGFQMNNKERLKKIMMMEYIENGQEFYEGFEDTWGPSRRFIQAFYDQAEISNEDVVQKRKLIIEKSKNIMQLAIDKSVYEKPRIPLIMHKIWMTRDDNPNEIPLERLDNYLYQAKKFDQFKHFLWLKDKSKIPFTVMHIENSQLPIEIHELKEIWPEFRGKDIFERYYEHKRLVATTDIIRFNLIYLFGGVYSDFGIEFHISPFFLCNYFECFTLREHWLLGTTVIGGKSKNIFLNVVLEYIDNLDRVPHLLRYLSDTNHAVPWTAICALTVFFDKTMQNESFIPLIWNNIFCTVNATGSWLKGVHGQNSVLKNRITNQEYFGDDLISIENGYNLKKGRWDDTITYPMSRVLFNKTWEDVELKRKQLMETSHSTYYQLFPKKINVIPHITHRCWFTSSENPFEVPQDKLDYYINSVKTLNVNSVWKHFFWCFDPDKIPNTIKYLLDANVGIEIKRLSDIYPQMKAKHVFDALINDNRYTNANDVSRMEIMNLYGGLYADIGIEFNRDLTPLLDQYEYFCLHNSICGHLDLGIMAFPKNSELSNAYLTRLRTLSSLPFEAKQLTPTSHLQFCWAGCNYWMAYIDSCIAPDTKMLFIEYNSPLIKLHRLQSWGANPSFGNKSILESTLDLFSIEPYS